MKIEEVIERVSFLVQSDVFDTHEEDREALKISIEAVRREKANRDNPDFVMVGKLPGETED